MLHNYLVLALKNLLKRRFVASINLLGLSTGIAVCVLIGLFIRHEKAYDRFHAKSERICRLNTTMKYPGASESTMPYSSYPMGPFLAETFGKEIEGWPIPCAHSVRNKYMRYVRNRTPLSAFEHVCAVLLFANN